MSRTQILLASAALAAAALYAVPAAAACAPDPQGDFIPTYTGLHLGEVDIRCIDARLDNGVYKLSVTADDLVGQSGKSYFVWGIDRGAGAPRLQFVGAPPPLRPDLNFDAIMLTFTDGSAAYSLLPPPNFQDLPNAVTISGNTLSVSIPLSYLPSTGFAPTSYRFTVWSDYQLEGALGDANNSFIADFSSTIFASVPEPASWAMMIAGFCALGMAARQRRRVAFA